MPAISRRAAASVHLRPRLLEVRAQVAVAGVLEGQVVEHLAVGAHQREAIEDADRARVPVEEQAEVGLAQPAVDARADLDADLLGDRRRPAAPRRQVGLPEAAGAEHPLDAVLQLGLGAEDHLRRRQQLAGVDRGHVDRRRGAGRGCGVAARRRHAGSLVRLASGPTARGRLPRTTGGSRPAIRAPAACPATIPRRAAAAPSRATRTARRCSGSSALRCRRTSSGSCGTSVITQTTAHTRLVMIDSVSTTLRIIQRRCSASRYCRPAR